MIDNQVFLRTHSYPRTSRNTTVYSESRHIADRAERNFLRQSCRMGKKYRVPSPYLPRCPTLPSSSASPTAPRSPRSPTAGAGSPLSPSTATAWTGLSACPRAVPAGSPSGGQTSPMPCGSPSPRSWPQVHHQARVVVLQTFQLGCRGNRRHNRRQHGIRQQTPTCDGRFPHSFHG